MTRWWVALVVPLIACGCAAKPTPAPPPKGPPPFDAAALAAELDGELTELARILHDHRDDCRRMASELRALFTKMQATTLRAREAQQDPERARQLTSAMRAFDSGAVERENRIDAEFSLDAPCAKDAAVRDVIMTMPTL